MRQNTTIRWLCKVVFCHKASPCYLWVLPQEHLVDHSFCFFWAACRIRLDAGRNDDGIVATFVECVADEKHLACGDIQFLRKPLDAEGFAHTFTRYVDRRFAADENLVAGELFSERRCECPAFMHVCIPHYFFLARSVSGKRRNRNRSVAINDARRDRGVFENTGCLNSFFNSMCNELALVFFERKSVGRLPSTSFPHVAARGIVGENKKVRGVGLVRRALQDVAFNTHEACARHNDDRYSFGEAEYLLQDFSGRWLETFSERVVQIEDDRGRRRGRGGHSFLLSHFPYLMGEREHGDDHDSEHDEFDIFLDVRYRLAEKISSQGKTAAPEDGTSEIIKEECRIAHFSHACEDRDEGANTGYEPSEQDGFRAMLFEEDTRLLKMLLFEKARILAAEECRPHPRTEPVADSIT